MNRVAHVIYYRGTTHSKPQITDYSPIGEIDLVEQVTSPDIACGSEAGLTCDLYLAASIIAAHATSLKNSGASAIAYQLRMGQIKGVSGLATVEIDNTAGREQIFGATLSCRRGTCGNSAVMRLIISDKPIQVADATE